MMEFKENITGLQHIGLPTGQFDQTIAFYSSLGFEIDLNVMLNEPNRKFRVAFLRFGDLFIETYEIPEDANRLVGAINHIALNVKDVDDAFEHAKATGLTLLDTCVDGLHFYENGVRFFTIVGPNGEKLEFNQKM